MNIKIIDTFINNYKIKELTAYFAELSIQEQQEFIKYLIYNLNSCQMPEDNLKRNTIVLVLADLKCNEAVPVIINLIQEQAESNYIGTLVYALQDLECAEYLEQIYYLIYKGNYEVRHNIFDLLEKNKNKMSPEIHRKICSNLEKAIEEYKDILLGLYIAKDEIFNDLGKEKI